MSIVDLIDNALADYETSVDAVRYNAPPPPSEPTKARHERRHLVLVDLSELIADLGVSLTKFFAAMNRHERMRRIHTAHPARWRKP